VYELMQCNFIDLHGVDECYENATAHALPNFYLLLVTAISAESAESSRGATSRTKMADTAKKEKWDTQRIQRELLDLQKDLRASLSKGIVP
jgi:hypothetical protein